MTSERPHTPDDRPTGTSAPAPDVTSVRLADRWDAGSWLPPAAGVVLGVLTLPAAAMVLVSLLVLVAQGVATWLVVTAASLVSTALGVVGTTVALRRGHPGVVHRAAVLAGVWGVVVTAAAVVLALRLDGPERTGVGVLLVLGGAYTIVLALALGAAARLLPAPVVAEPAHPQTAPAPTVNEVPTPAAAPDDAEADWPEWGAGSVVGTIPPLASEDPATGTPADSTPVDRAASTGTPSTGTPTAGTPSTGTPTDGVRRTAPKVVEFVLPEDDVVDAEVVEPVAPARRTSPRRPVRESTRAPRTSAARTSAARTPERRSATSGRTTSRARTAAGEPTEHIARQDGDDGPPTQRLPPVVD